MYFLFYLCRVVFHRFALASVCCELNLGGFKLVSVKKEVFWVPRAVNTTELVRVHNQKDNMTKFDEAISSIEIKAK